MKLNPYDLEQEIRRVRSLTKSAEGRAALHRELGIVFADDHAAENKLPVVAMLVPTRSTPTPETYQAVERMLAHSRGHAMVIPQPAISSSVVHWVRNDLYTSLRKSGLKYDFVLLMDDDMNPAPDAILRLLAHDKDIVAAGCTVRKDPPIPNFRVYFPEELNYKTAKDWYGDGLMEIGAVGTAFMLVRREVFDTIGEYYLSCRHERDFMGMSEESAKFHEEARRKRAELTGNQWWFEFLKHPQGEGEFGEDISFCFKAMRCGIKTYVDTSLRVGHMGSYSYSLDDYCGPMKEEKAEEDAFKETPALQALGQQEPERAEI